MTPAAPPRYRPYQPLRAIKALIGLARNTSRTDHVFEIITALSGDRFEQVFQEFLAAPGAETLLREKRSLMAVLGDRDALRALPAGSLGRAYLVFMERNGLTAEGLVAAQDTALSPTDDLELDPDRQFVSDRLRDQHDLWHVLTDYGMDDTGEISNLWFSYAQFGSLGMAFIAALGTLDGLQAGGREWLHYCVASYRRGRAARKLVSVDFEALLAEPIDDVRRQLGIGLSCDVHPRGIRSGNRVNHQLGAVAA